MNEDGSCRDTHKDFVKAQALHLFVPRVRAQKSKERLAHVAKGRQVLAVDQDQVGADLLGLGDEHQLLDALPPRHVVAGGEDALLLDAERQCLKLRPSILKNRGVEAVVVLEGRSERTGTPMGD